PNSQSTRATVGPAAPVVNSTTRIPSKGSLDIDLSQFTSIVHHEGREEHEAKKFKYNIFESFMSFVRFVVRLSNFLFRSLLRLAGRRDHLCSSPVRRNRFPGYARRLAARCAQSVREIR